MPHRPISSLSSSSSPTTLPILPRLPSPPPSQDPVYPPFWPLSLTGTWATRLNEWHAYTAHHGHRIPSTNWPTIVNLPPAVWYCYLHPELWNDDTYLTAFPSSTEVVRVNNRLDQLFLEEECDLLVFPKFNGPRRTPTRTDCRNMVLDYLSLHPTTVNLEGLWRSPSNTVPPPHDARSWMNSADDELWSDEAWDRQWDRLCPYIGSNPWSWMDTRVEDESYNVLAERAGQE